MRSTRAHLARLAALTSSLMPHARRRTLRRGWSAWASEALRRLGALRSLEAERARRSKAELEAKEAQLEKTRGEALALRTATSLWGEDELPAMLESLSLAAVGAEAAAIECTPIDGAAGRAASSAARSEAMHARKEAADSAAGWQGMQLRLTVAVLDSLKRELARERAALASARSEAKQSDLVAEQALAMLQQLREEGASLQARLASLEDAQNKGFVAT